MADFFDPFGGNSTPKYARLGGPETGSTILQSLGYIASRENTKDMQQAAREQAKMIIIQGEAEREASRRLGISESEAALRFSPVRDASGELIPAELELRDFLTREDLEELLAFQIDPEKKEKAATMMMRYRYAWGFVVEAAEVSAEAVELVEPLKFSITQGDRFRYEDSQGVSRYFVVASDAAAGATSLKVKKLKAKIEREAIAIRQVDGGDQVGFPSWTDEYSSRLRPQAKNLLYGFYMAEMSISVFGRAEEEGNEPESSTSNSLENTVSQSQSTGWMSGAESSDPESLAPDLAA